MSRLTFTFLVLFLSTQGLLSLNHDYSPIDTLPGEGRAMELSIGDMVWEDVVPDNHFNGAADFPISNLTVQLYRDQNGDQVAQLSEFVQSTQTNTGGQYLFSNLETGTYFVVVPPSQLPLQFYTNVQASSTPNDDIDNDSNALSGGPHGPGGYITGG